VIAVQVHSAIPSEGKDYLGSPFADVFDNRASERVEVLSWQITIGKVQHFMRGDAEHFAGCGEFSPTQLPQLGRTNGFASEMGGLSVCQAEDAGFYAVTMSHEQRGAEGCALIVRMGSYAE
jgi:hypothetical protein